jgi:hypothetical protein
MRCEIPAQDDRQSSIFSYRLEDYPMTIGIVSKKDRIGEMLKESACILGRLTK